MRPLENFNILVVDDEPDLREIIATELKMAGANTFEAENGEAALDIVKKEKPHGILTDVRMAGGNGIELLENVRSLNQKMPVVIVLSGFSDISPEEAVKRGATAMFTKPCDFSILIEVFRQNLSK